MKRLTLIFLFALAVLFVPVLPLNAQSHMIEAQIPFSFTVENVTLAAGEYTFTSLTPNTVVVRPKGGGGAVLTLTAISGDDGVHA